MMKIQQNLITPPHPLILQIPPRSHPAVYLVAERLNVLVLGPGQSLAEFSHGVGVFVAGCERAKGDFYAPRVG